MSTWTAFVVAAFKLAAEDAGPDAPVADVLQRFRRYTAAPLTGKQPSDG